VRKCVDYVENVVISDSSTGWESFDVRNSIVSLVLSLVSWKMDRRWVAGVKTVSGSIKEKGAKVESTVGWSDCEGSAIT
jgi:hypothetical protein